MRHWIAASLKIGALLLVVVFVAAALWGILSAVGDKQGARAACVVAMVFLACWLLDFVALVVLLAVASLKEAGEKAEGGQE